MIDLIEQERERRLRLYIGQWEAGKLLSLAEPAPPEVEAPMPIVPQVRGMKPKYRRGSRVGMYILLEEVAREKRLRRRFKCKCRYCNAERIADIQDLPRRKCPCKHKSIITSPPIGEKFGNLTVIREVKRIGRRRMLECKCKCGTVKPVRMFDLKLGNIKSCGCSRAENSASRTHGLSQTKQFHVWRQMIRKHPGQVSERWLDITNFHADMGFKPDDPKISLLRMDPTKLFCKENCVWMKRSEQYRLFPQAFKRVNAITIDGETFSKRGWARKHNIPTASINSAMRRMGLSFEDALKWSIEHGKRIPGKKMRRRKRHVVSEAA